MSTAVSATTKATAVSATTKATHVAAAKRFVVTAAHVMVLPPMVDTETRRVAMSIDRQSV
jgi:hypothetical protein